MHFTVKTEVILTSRMQIKPTNMYHTQKLCYDFVNKDYFVFIFSKKSEMIWNKYDNRQDLPNILTFRALKLLATL